MHALETMLLMMMAVVALVASARHLNIPYPILLVLGGLCLGFVPGLPAPRLTPDIVFLLFLPPLLFSEAWFTSWRDFRRNLRPIGLLAIGLVLITTAAVALVVHGLFPNFPLPAAFVLGAIAAPTDAVAVSAIGERLHLPRRILVILSGESLVNDATALVVYRTAVAAVVSGSFSLGAASLHFVIDSIGGVAVGLVLGLLLVPILRRVEEATLFVTVSILMPFAAYLTAERLGVSGVLATVVLGLFAGRQAPQILSARARVQGRAFWNVFVFLLNGLLFILVGLQLHGILVELEERSFVTLALYTVVACLSVILARVLWVFGTAYAGFLLRRNRPRPDPAPAWRPLTILAWAGARGGVSLASALAVPLVVEGGRPFPQRDLILFLTFGIIFATLVLQGLSLPPLIRRLELSDDGSGDREEKLARMAAAQAALARLEELTAASSEISPSVMEEARERYTARLIRLNAPPESKERERLTERRLHSLQLQRELLEAENRAVIALRDEGRISDDALHRIQLGLDLDELRITPLLAVAEEK